MKYGFSQVSAERIAQGGTALALEVEECELPAEAVVELNVGNEAAQTWKELDQLSTGQKATAVCRHILDEPCEEFQRDHSGSAKCSKVKSRSSRSRQASAFNRL